MSVRIENYDHGGDSESSPSRRRSVNGSRRTRTERLPSHEHYIHIERDTPRHAGDSNPPKDRHRASHARKKSRKKSRNYPDERDRTKPTSEELDQAQDSDDVLNDFYGRTETIGFYPDPTLDTKDDYRRPSSRPYTRRYTRYARPMAAEIDIPMSLHPGAPSQAPSEYDDGYRPTHGHTHVHLAPETMAYGPPNIEIIRTAPRGEENDKLWTRSAKESKDPDRLRVRIRLLLKRKGDRFKSSPFEYETGAWDDAQLALQIVHQYRTLKTSQIGFMQKLTSYKMISFLYFLQYRFIYNHEYNHGSWELDRIPITDNDSGEARSAFMYQLQNHVRQESRLFHAFSRKEFEPAKKVSRDWVRRLNRLIELGVVIDIEVKETFDAMKIYFGLLLAILLSLGVALLYGFLVDRDFSTGFSIASWLLTAFGFFAAVVAAGEYLGLEKPTATLTAGEDLRAGPVDRGLLEGDNRLRTQSHYRPYRA